MLFEAIRHIDKSVGAAFVLATMFFFSVMVLNGSFWKSAVVFAFAWPLCCMGSVRPWLQPLAIVAFIVAMVVFLEFVPSPAKWSETLLALRHSANR